MRRSPRVSCERQSCQLIAEIRCASSTKAPPALWARLHKPWGQKQQRHLWQVMIPSPKIWVMAKKAKKKEKEKPHHLLRLKSLLLSFFSSFFRRATCVLQQHVPELRGGPRSHRSAVGVLLEPSQPQQSPDERASAFICRRFQTASINWLATRWSKVN